MRRMRGDTRIILVRLLVMWGGRGDLLGNFLIYKLIRGSFNSQIEYVT
jgi:hypothetical protein